MDNHSAPSSAITQTSALNRRSFFTTLGVGAVAATGACLTPSASASPAFMAKLNAQYLAWAQQRRNQAFQIRVQAATAQRNSPQPAQTPNRDEALYTNRFASYTKALPHNSLGEVNPSAYQALLNALSSGKSAGFSTIPMGDPVKLANPQAAYAYNLEGADSSALAIPAAPAFSSAEAASEMGEVYWHALTREVPFNDYASNAITLAAAADLSAFSDFRGPKSGGMVTPATLFRGNTPGDLTGPYVSQLLWQDIPYGSTVIEQRYPTTANWENHMTSYADWLHILNGGAPTTTQTFDPVLRYIRNGRDLGEYVHRDFTYQAFLHAALILLGYGPSALDANNPYLGSATQGSFITFGGAHILDIVARVANQALKAAWYQKWLVHRRLRPEVFGGRIHNHLIGAASYPIHPDILNSPVLDAVHDLYGTYLLPMAYAEGSPTHPAYPAGHATIAGACATVLKAFFKESMPVPNPVVASSDGLSLLPYSGAALTVGGELNKLASNIAIGRDLAGVHYRTDGIEGLKLGEAVAVSCLRDHKATYNESFAGFSLTTFSGQTIVI